MMNGGDLYELAKILWHSNVRMTERYAKLAKQHPSSSRSTWTHLIMCSEMGQSRSRTRCYTKLQNRTSDRPYIDHLESFRADHLKTIFYSDSLL
jgi:hypothetical protein